MSDNFERRAYIGDFRVETRTGKTVIEGHAAVFGQRADIFGFTEEVAAGAFRESIGKDDIRALVNHDPNLVLGRNRSGTLRLREDAIGLHAQIDPPDTQAARDLLELLQRGDISQMSFGFKTLEDSWSDGRGGLPHRVLKRVQLFDVSPVTFPAYAQTDVGVAVRRAAARGIVIAGAGSDAGHFAASDLPWQVGAQARDRQLELISRQIFPGDRGRARALSAAREMFLRFRLLPGQKEPVRGARAAAEAGERELLLLKLKRPSL